jgi:hypothetical protein
VVSLAPGVIDTDMQGSVRGIDEAQFMDVASLPAHEGEG